MSAGAKKVILIVRDGWGHSRRRRGNAVRRAQTDWTDKTEKEYPTFLLKTSGSIVGLPEGFVGDSEVGHITIGAGRQIDQALLRIHNSINDESFFSNPTILNLIQNVKKHESRLHLMGIFQKEGVHGHFEHLVALLKYAKKEGLKGDDVVIHLFTDGRDAHPKNAVNYLAELADVIYHEGIGVIGTITGRYFAMDRDQRWKRTVMAYQAIFRSQGEEFECGLDTLEKKYKEGMTDEFMTPLVRKDYPGVGEKDAFFFWNFRKDRGIQLTQMILDKNPNLLFSSMTRYYVEQSGQVAFDDVVPEDTLGDILEEENKSQFRISETEKFAHVTFFFDGGTTKKHRRRQDVLIPSPKVETYDQQPELSSDELTDKVLDEIESRKPDFILINYPNGDLVGHTGDHEAAKKAIETVDSCCEKIVEVGLKENYSIILTADHGNAEDMRGKHITSHSQNPVPTTIITKENNLKAKKGKFSLQNIAPTVLQLMGIKKPTDMAESLIEE